jgi:hypothetical protein
MQTTNGMKRTLLTGVVALTLTGLSAACQSAATTPSTSVPAAEDTAVLGPGGSSLKASAPTLVSPAASSTSANLLPTFTVAGGTLTYSSVQPQYRIRVTDPTGTVTADSGLISGTSWTVPLPLTPTTTYTWMARSEARGLVGPWSSSRSFTTPVAPGNDYGAWETTCAGRTGIGLVTCVYSFVNPTNSMEDFEVTKRVAWLLRGSGGGLLLKNSGENVVPWMGTNFSASRICFPDGHIFKIFSDAGPGGANTPIYSDNDFVPVTDYFPARDPRLR